MPRVRASPVLRVNGPSEQLARLLLDGSSRITTSTLPQLSLENVLQKKLDAQSHPVHLRTDLKHRLVQLPNHGEIVGVKDNFVTTDLPSTCASNILEGFSAQDATAVKLLKEAGMDIVAKTNMDEFGMGSHSTHSAYGAVRNSSCEPPLSVGGSSGGSALAVASGLVDSALGSDTGGSVRLPASYTSIIGFKPSYGMISRRGLIPYANSLDTVGIFAKSCHDVLHLYYCLAKYDSQDPTSLRPETRVRINHAQKEQITRNGVVRRISSRNTLTERFSRSSTRRQGPIQSRYSETLRRIGVPIEYKIEEMHPSVRMSWIQTLSNLQRHGHQIVPISLPSTQQALSAYYVLAPAEASSNLAKYDGVRYGKARGLEFSDDEGGVLYSQYRGAYFGEEVKRRILLGSFTLSAGAIDNFFIQAQKVRRLVQSDFDMVFRMANPLIPRSKAKDTGVDYIVCPTAPTPPPTLKEVERAGPLESYMNDVFTVPASLAGLPAISVPASQQPGMPRGHEWSVGMQVIGQFGDDAGVIKFARTWLEPGTRPPVKKVNFMGRARLT